MTHTNRIRAGVAVAPVTDWRNYDSIHTERYLGPPSPNATQDPNDVYTLDSPIANAAKLKGRILIAHGTGDDNVHMTNTIQFLQPLIDAGIPYDLQLFPRKTTPSQAPLRATNSTAASSGNSKPTSSPDHRETLRSQTGDIPKQRLALTSQSLLAK